MSSERRVRPLVVLGRNDVGVRIEEDRREIGVRTRPFEEDQRLALHEFNCLGFEGEGFGLGDDEIGSFVVVGVRLDGVNLKVLLEPGYDRGGRR